MKLLFDENLSPRLVRMLAGEFPGSAHVELLGMRGADDRSIWEYAGAYGYTIVSKDNDFRQRSIYFGPPPKVVWLSVGNAGTQDISDTLRRSVKRIAGFQQDSSEALLAIELKDKFR